MNALILYPRRAGFLRAVRDVLSPPGAWTQGAYARTAGGHSTTASSPEARCWCLAGAIDRVLRFPLAIASDGTEDGVNGQQLIHLNGPRVPFIARLQLIHLRASINGAILSIPRLNDLVWMTHAKILGYVDAAIARFEA